MKRLCLFMAACAATPALAQDADPTRLDPLVVTATRDEQRQSEVAASIDVITREQIERAQANDLADLLLAVAGVDIARNGGPGSPASVFIRGLESNHTLFLVDGVRFTTETFLNAQIQNLAPEMIERIEVVKGPRSGLWGSDAMGGVVNIITRRATSGFSGGGSLRAGNFGTRDLSAFAGYAGQSGDVSASIEAQNFDGYPPLRTGGEDRGHDNVNGRVNAGLALGEARLELAHLEAGGTNEYVDFSGAPRSQDFTNRISALSWAFPVTEAWSMRVGGSLAQDELTQLEPSDPTRPNRFDFTEVQRTAAEWENRASLGDVAVTAGLAASRSEIDQTFYSGFGDSELSDHSEQQAAFARLAMPLGPVDGSISVRHADHNRFGGHTTGDIALGWRVGRTHIGLTGGTAYKEPELTDLYGDFGNPDLEPERSGSVEANVRQPFGDTQVLTAAVFETRVRDLIAFDPATFTPENIARTRIRGFEAGWRYDDGTWNANLSGSMQNPVDEDSGETLLRRSRRSLQAGAGGRWGRWSGSLEAVAHGERFDTGDARMGGYTLLNAAAAWRFAPAWSIALRGNNLLDKDYELIKGFRTPERNGSITVRASF